MTDIVDITCKIERELRKKFKLTAMKRGKTIREVLPKIIQAWISKNK